MQRSCQRLDRVLLALAPDDEFPLDFRLDSVMNRLFCRADRVPAAVAESLGMARRTKPSQPRNREMRWKIWHGITEKPLYMLGLDVGDSAFGGDTRRREKSMRTRAAGKMGGAGMRATAHNKQSVNLPRKALVQRSSGTRQPVVSSRDGLLTNRTPAPARGRRSLRGPDILRGRSGPDRPAPASGSFA